MMVVNENRVRIRAGWFSVNRKDENHDYYGLIFTTEDHNQDVIVEIEDVRKLTYELTDCLSDYPKSIEMHSKLTKKQLVELCVHRLGTINGLRKALRDRKEGEQEE